MSYRRDRSLSSLRIIRATVGRATARDVRDHPRGATHRDVAEIPS